MDYTEYFQKYPDAYKNFESSLNRVETLYNFLVGHGLLDGVDSLLSIGAGSGLVEVRAARERGIRIGIEEPTRPLFERFQANAREAGVENLVIEAKPCTFQDYQPTQPYDLVLSLYSWFPFGFDPAMLDKALACRRKGGTFALFIQAESTFSALITKGHSRSTGITLTAETLSNWAREAGYAHEYAVYRGWVNAATYFDDDNLCELNEMGRNALAFLAATPWQDLPEERRYIGRRILQTAVIDNRLDIPSGVLIFR